MGTDIYCHVEKYDKSSDKWVRLDLEVFKVRRYSLFGWLGGVCNYSAVSPIAPKRDLPEDTSYATWCHTLNNDVCDPSWVSVHELDCVDYDREIEDLRVDGLTCEPGQGVKTTLRDFLDPAYFEDLERLKLSGAERLIFWFD